MGEVERQYIDLDQYYNLSTYTDTNHSSFLEENKDSNPVIIENRMIIRDFGNGDRGKKTILINGKKQRPGDFLYEELMAQE